MPTSLLYALTVLIWGTTWLAIKWQVGAVPPEVSLGYRFALAFLLLSIYCRARGFSLKFPLKDHLFLFLLGVCNFSVHLVCLYTASLYLVSGLVSILFSFVSVFNIFNTACLFKKRPEPLALCGACIGLAGIALFFWNDLSTLSWQQKTYLGVGWGLLGAFIFSCGNMIFRQSRALSSSLIAGCTLANGYGSLLMLLYSWFKGSPFLFSANGLYWGSFFYLIVVGSIGFLCYLTLIKRIGPEKTGYATLFFPMVALLLSSLFEGYTVGLFELCGIGCVVFGNFLVMRKKRREAVSA